MEKHDLTRLEAKIKDVASSISALAARSEALGAGAGEKTLNLSGLIAIIHRPGWTTPAEWLFVNGILDSMAIHTEALAGLQQSLLAGSAAVGNNR